jgi:hypothetical protein
VVSREVWLLIHRDARRLARVAVTIDWLVEQFGADAAALSGDSGEHASSGRR